MSLRVKTSTADWRAMTQAFFARVSVLRDECLLICSPDYSVNVTTGEKEERPMLTGMHTVVDIFRVGGSIVGWKYESAHEKSQKYKQGKFILERYQVIGPYENENVINHEAQLGSDTDDA